MVERERHLGADVSHVKRFLRFGEEGVPVQKKVEPVGAET